MDVEEDVDQQITTLLEEYDRLDEEDRHTSARRAALAVYRLAKAHGRAVPLIRALFRLTNSSWSLLEPAQGRDYALEMIALVESEDRARGIQPDLPEHAYALACRNYTTCAYDNLARHLADIHGHNSEGLHACVADGLDVCQRTGKTSCVPCFRSYAGDVHLAADDLELSMHFSRLVSNLPEDAPGAYRGFPKAYGETKTVLLLGDLDGAFALARRALGMAGRYHRKKWAAWRAQLDLFDLYHLEGRPAAFAEEFPDFSLDGYGHGKEEDPASAALAGRSRALAAACAGDFAAAAELLTGLDRLYAERQVLTEWFEVRLRLVALAVLQGNRGRAEALAKPLQSKAEAGRDWLTVRRLGRLMHEAAGHCPYPLLAPLSRGPFATAPSRAVPLPAAAPEAEAPPEAQAPPSRGERVERASTLLERAHQTTQAEDFRAAREAVLGIPPEELADGQEAAWLLYLLIFMLQEDIERAWGWTEAVKGRFPQHAGVLNLAATVGDVLSNDPEEPTPEGIDRKELEKWYRLSLDLDPYHPTNHLRAGHFFSSEGNEAEAERCYARGFRLNRGDARLARALAATYENAGRQQDALWALDTCIREGAGDAEVFWRAGTLAYSLQQWESCLAYFAAHERLSPGQQGTELYRGECLLRLGRLDEADAALERELERGPFYPLLVVSLQAEVASAKGDVARVERHVRQFLETDLAASRYSSPGRVEVVGGRLWRAARALGAGAPLRRELADRLLQTTTAPFELFSQMREAAPERGDLPCFGVVLRQPLDENWLTFPGRIAGEEKAVAYSVSYVVLAESEEQAAEMALAVQARVYPPLPAEVEVCEEEETKYRDRPGVVAQRFREVEESEGEGGE